VSVHWRPRLVLFCFKETNATGAELASCSARFRSHLQATGSDANTDEFVYPTSCAQFTISGVRDLTAGIELELGLAGSDRMPTLPCSSSTQMITFFFANGCEITIRASGTEPKIKWYSEIIKKNTQAGLQSSADNELFRQQAKNELDQLVDAVLRQFVQPERNQMIQRVADPK
jgi:phosphomannomutase